MDETLHNFADRITTRESSRSGALSSESMAAAWAMFQRDWEFGIVYENFLIDLTDRIKEHCPKLEFIDTDAARPTETVKFGSVVTNSLGHNAVLEMVNWNGYWDSPLISGPRIQYPEYPITSRSLTSTAFVEQLPQHLDTIADKFVAYINDKEWNVFSRLELPEGCTLARWIAPLRLVRSYVVDHDVFISRFDMLGGKAQQN